MNGMQNGGPVSTKYQLDMSQQDQLDELRAFVIEQAEMLAELRNVILAMGAVAGAARVKSRAARS